MATAHRLCRPVRPGDPSIASQVFDLCGQACEDAGGYLAPHPEEHAFIVVFGGKQVTVTVSDHDSHH